MKKMNTTIHKPNGRLHPLCIQKKRKAASLYRLQSVEPGHMSQQNSAIVDKRNLRSTIYGQDLYKNRFQRYILSNQDPFEK